jgi:membrane-bound lytic murein transglycosylase D
MPRPRRQILGAVCALGLLTAACAPKAPTIPSHKPEPIASAAPAPLAPDPVPDFIGELIAESMRHFERGEQELQDGHLEMARAAFNRALEVLLESSYGARDESRIRVHFDQLVERVSALEAIALAQGDGFTEQRHEPATIDELLALSTFERPDATAETERRVAADLARTMHDIDIPLNPRVLSAVQLFSNGRMKSFLEEGLSRGAQYLPMIQDVLRAEGLPLDLAFVPLVESAFKPSALSRARARGVWQFMHGTGLEMGLTYNWYIDERADVEKSTRAAARYLKLLYNMFGDWHLALASYNAGPGRVQRALKQSGLKDYWSLSASSRFLPRETRDYVPLILAATVVARNPAEYGIEFQPWETSEAEAVVLPTPVDLRRVAEWTGTPVQTIQQLNPELRRWITPVGASEYLLKVPRGTAEMVLAAVAESHPEDLAPLNRHTVKRGETLASIARSLNVNRTDLAEANYLSSSARLTVGDQLIIPRQPTLLLTTRTGTAPGDAVGTAGTVAEPAAPTRQTYQVRRGDTLTSIAKRYATTVASLKEWNNLRSDAIRIGQRLTILAPIVATR